jgi:hypothetical protein
MFCTLDWSVSCFLLIAIIMILALWLFMIYEGYTMILVLNRASK